MSELNRAAVEFGHSFSFSTVHIYLRKNLFLRKIVCIWPLKFNKKLGKITQYDTRYVGGFGCD